MSDTKTTKELYGLYVQRYGNCNRTPYQADYYKKWLDLLNSCSTNEEAQEKSKQNGLYSAGAAVVAMDRVFANKQAALEMGWNDVAEFCDEILQKIESDPYYTFTHSGLWGDLQAKKNGWIKTIESFHRLFIDFVEFDDTRCEPFPMCLSALYWAGVSRIWYGNTKSDADKIGFGDDFIYKEIEKPYQDRSIPIAGIMRKEALAAFKAWENLEDKIEY